jgi:hypothetical protein
MRQTRKLGQIAVVLTACFGAAQEARAQDGPAPTGSPGPSGPPSVPAAGNVVLHVTSDRPGAVLAQFDFLGSGPRYGYYDVTRICTAPCDAHVSSGDMSYRIVGPRMTPSPSFSVAPETGELDVHVHVGSWGAYAAGLALAATGAAYTACGGGFLIAREATLSSSTTERLVPLGAVFLSAGVVGLAVGVPLLVMNRTRLDLRSRALGQGTVRFGPAGLTF